jgi:hypothetical protein
MAFRIIQDLDKVYRKIEGHVSTSRNIAKRLRDRMLEGAVPGEDILNLARQLHESIDLLNQLKQTTGIAAFYREKMSDPAYDVAAEFTATVVAMQAVITNITDTYPKSSNGYDETAKTMGDGSVSFRSFSTGATAGLRDVIAIFLLSIEYLDAQGVPYEP